MSWFGVGRGVVGVASAMTAAVMTLLGTGIEPLAVRADETPAADQQPDTAGEPIRSEFSLSKAAEYLDRRAHYKEEGCYACHSTFTYLPARSLIDPLAGEVMRTRVMLTRLMTRLNDPSQAGMVKMSHVRTVRVLAALELARHDAATTGKLSSVARQSLDKMWTLQSQDGGFAWLHVGEAPQAIDDWWPAAMVAIGVAAAPERYAEQDDVQERLEKLRLWFRANRPESVHEQCLTLAADAALGGILTQEERGAAVAMVGAKQREDGGWSMASIAPWKRKDGRPIDPERSDGYATALGVYALTLRQTGEVSPAAIKGVNWLKRNQRESGGWFTQSPFRRDPIASNTGTSFAIQALATAGEIVPRRVTEAEFQAALAEAEANVPEGVIAP